MRRLLTIPLATSAALLAALLAACGTDDPGSQQTAVAGLIPAQATCDEEQVREAIVNSGAVERALEFEITYLRCDAGFGWATIDAPALDESATVLLRVSDAGTEVLDLGTSLCTADAGMPADIAAQIAPPGVDPAGDCPSPAQQPRITVSPSTAAPGDTVTFSGNIPVADDCPPGDESARLTSSVDFFPPDGSGPQAPRDADGNFQVTYTIPTTTAPGTYTIGLRCGGGNVGVSTALQVTLARTTTSTEAETPSTAGPPTPAPAEPRFTG